MITGGAALAAVVAFPVTSAQANTADDRLVAAAAGLLAADEAINQIYRDMRLLASGVKQRVRPTSERIVELSTTCGINTSRR
jgi:hypothetical protein